MEEDDTKTFLSLIKDQEFFKIVSCVTQNYSNLCHMIQNRVR